MTQLAPEVKTLQNSQIITVALCFTSPVIFAFVLFRVVFKGDPSRVTLGVDKVPWDDPLVLIVIIFALMAAGFGVAIGRGILPLFNASDRGPNAPNIRHIIACASVESAAILGLVLALILGPNVGLLALGLMTIPPIGGVLIFPTKSK